MSTEKDRDRRDCNRPSAPPVDLRERQQMDLTPAEEGWIRIAVGRVLRTLSWNDREYLRDDAEQQAAIKILSLRLTLARLAGEERDRYAVTSLRRDLFRWEKVELARRRQLDPPRAAGEECEPVADLPDPEAGDWEERIARSLLDGVGDEQIAAALRSLTPLQVRTLNLHYFRGLCLREIGELLHAPEETVKTRLDGALAKLRRSLGIAPDARGPRRAKKSKATAPLP